MQRLLAATLASAILASPVRPSQTRTQKAALSSKIAAAQQQSADSKAWLLGYLEKTVKPELPSPFSGYTAEHLLEMLEWELNHIPIIHNGPADAADPSALNGTSDDSDVDIVFNYRYLHNVCQRYALRIPGHGQDQDYLVGEHGVMVKYFGLPAFADEKEPSLAEANDCILYFASNLKKTHLGNFEFGAITYVIDPKYRTSMSMTPFDTGAYVSQFGTTFGYMDDWYHLVQPHVRVYGYNMADVMKRWWSGAAPVAHADKYEYFEYQLYNQALLPESLLYIALKWSSSSVGEGLAGKATGDSVRSWMLAERRPLVWADGEDSGMLLDPTVCAPALLGEAASRIQASDQQGFEDTWTAARSSPVTFVSVFQASATHLRLEYLSYLTKDSCDESTGGIIGVNGVGDCVYSPTPVAELLI